MASCERIRLSARVPPKFRLSTFATFSKPNGTVVNTQAILLLLLVGVVILVWRSFFSGYASKKGENLATEEDIRRITNEVEDVKALYAKQLKELEHQNERVLEQLRSRQQLRMAAAEKRLQVHQEAFALWRKLMYEANSPAVITTVGQCQEWWERNCLYLSPDARDAFRQAYFAAADHPSYLAKGGGFTGAEVRENFRIIREAGAAIVKGAELPDLGEGEAEDVTDTGRRAR